MKKIALLVAIIFSGQVHAQSRLHYGVHGGMNWSILSGRDAGPWVDYKLHRTLGLYLSFDVSKNLAFQIECNRTRKGSDLEPDSYEYYNGNYYTIVSYERELLIDYWDFPLCVKYQLPKLLFFKPYLAAGAFLATADKIQKKTTYTYGGSGSSTENYSSRIHDWDKGYIFKTGVSYELEGPIAVIFIEGKFTKSSSPIYKKTSIQIESYNKTYEILLGIGR